MTEPHPQPLGPRPSTSRPVLSDRHLACLKLAAQGFGSREIGARLDISARTVDDHLAEACRRLGVRTRVQAVVWLVQSERWRRGPSS